MRKNVKGSADRADAKFDMVGDGALGGLFDIGYYGEISPVWGALVGGVLTEAGILIAKSMRAKSPRVAKYAGLMGLAFGGVPSAVALIFHSTRRAGYLGLAVTAIASVGELLRAFYVEPSLGLYEGETAGAFEIMDNDADEIAESMIAGALGEVPGLQMLGQYSPDFAGFQPMEVMGGSLGTVPTL